LQTVAISPPGLIEVYPHPALVELANAPTRLPYKAGNVGKYWPELNSEGRHLRLYQQWRQIVLLLDREIGGVADALPELAVGLRGVALKSYEDKLDAVVCAWVAICALKGKAEPFGDEESAIWIPAPLHA
jgi:predicted RNase H-like nuclease